MDSLWLLWELCLEKMYAGKREKVYEINHVCGKFASLVKINIPNCRTRIVHIFINNNLSNNLFHCYNASSVMTGRSIKYFILTYCTKYINNKNK